MKCLVKFMTVRALLIAALAVVDADSILRYVSIAAPVAKAAADAACPDGNADVGTAPVGQALADDAGRRAGRRHAAPPGGRPGLPVTGGPQR